MGAGYPFTHVLLCHPFHIYSTCPEIFETGRPLSIEAFAHEHNGFIGTWNVRELRLQALFELQVTHLYKAFRFDKLENRHQVFGR